MLDEKRILPCSVLLQGEFGIKGTCVGLPVILDAGGAEKIVEIDLNDEETEMLKTSAA